MRERARRGEVGSGSRKAKGKGGGLQCTRKLISTIGNESNSTKRERRRTLRVVNNSAISERTVRAGFEKGEGRRGRK